MVKKKKKDAFTLFRSTDKYAYKTFKIPLKTILCHHKEVQPILNHLVFDINHLVIHSYQFIRLYLLNLYHKKESLPTIDETFILYCIKTLGIRDNRGKQSNNTTLLEQLETFYTTTYQPLLQHEKTNLKNTTFLLPYVAAQVTAVKFRD